MDEVETGNDFIYFHTRIWLYLIYLSTNKHHTNIVNGVLPARHIYSNRKRASHISVQNDDLPKSDEATLITSNRYLTSMATIVLHNIQIPSERING